MFQIIDMTDMGNGRDSNQDSYLLKEEEICGQQILMAAMCDGMGGLSRGEIASGYIVGSLDRWFTHTLPVLLKQKMKIMRIQKELVAAIKKINHRLILLSREYGDTMGSTLTLLFAADRRFFVLNIGDSRAYWFDREQKYVTRDHTLVQEEVSRGLLTIEEARTDARKHILMQCIGVTKEITIDCYNGKIKPGMEFLLCTDGFYGMLREEEIYEVEASKDEMKRWVRECFDKVKERGELDNLSCIVVKVS